MFDEIETVIHARDLVELRRVRDDATAGATGRIDVGSAAGGVGGRRGVRPSARRRRRTDLGAGPCDGGQAGARRRAQVCRRYDAVIVDEAQDLDASALRLLVEVCAEPNRLFVTADVNQTIHAAGFSWQAVHDDLRFVGRTGVLRANHRSTKEITEAARDYLAAGIAEDLQPDEQSYVHTGPPQQSARSQTSTAEADLVARFLRGATRELRLTIGSGAVLVPDKYVGEPLAEALEERGIPAVYRNSRDFELDDNSISILPLTAAKGLEFPVVAVAGFGKSNWPHLDGLDGDAEIEAW